MDGEEMLLEMFSDITRRKAAEELLREGEERFRMVFENMSNAVAVSEISREWTLPHPQLTPEPASQSL
ncbi:MAG: hypothetical protein U9N46_08875 [Euryarchaeota archaeon]|nr:hypothetical protein [Euryarchaeota archaeon]